MTISYIDRLGRRSWQIMKPSPTKCRGKNAMAQDSREIHAVLMDAASGLQDKITRGLGDYTVALLAISGFPEQPRLAGTGTLLTAGGAHFILTARHVWEEVLKETDVVGITLKPDVKHRLGINRRDIAVFGSPKPDAWNEWGPDLMLLRIPAEHIGSIAAVKVFLNVERPMRKIDLKVLWVQVLMGAPGAFSKTTGTHMELQITGMFLSPETKHERDGFDYLDYEMDLKFPVPRNFGGVSGGGVWEIYLYHSPENGEIVWSTSLHGVAFYQLPIVAEHRPIRCHGPESIKTILREVGCIFS